MTITLRSAAPLLLAAACTTSTPPDPAAGVAQRLGVAASTDLVGTWEIPDAGAPGGFKVMLELDADGSYTMQDHSTQPATDTAGAWGVAAGELELIADPDDGAAYHVTAWTYLFAAGRLGIGYAGTSTSGPVGTWTAALIDEDVDASATPTSGTTKQVALALAANGTASSHEVDTPAGGAATTADLSGTYTVNGDGSLAVTLGDDNGTSTEALLPIAAGYADPIFVFVTP